MGRWPRALPPSRVRNLSSNGIPERAYGDGRPGSTPASHCKPGVGTRDWHSLHVPKKLLLTWGALCQPLQGGSCLQRHPPLSLQGPASPNLLSAQAYLNFGSGPGHYNRLAVLPTVFEWRAEKSNTRFGSEDNAVKEGG